MAQKRPVINSERRFDSSRFVTRKEFDHAIASLKETISSLQNKQQGNLSALPDAPRPRIFHKRKEGKRQKLATTIDGNLFELIKQRQQTGQQLSHVIDSALWHYFGRPKLSFESSDKD